ncbi:MAG TPA: aminotransferase class III-fold pyridoxal phosphate-dependent enzyme, partial [Terriglobales bacterium]|nr:aminotransferase class III-fold pyridoxal phosphate-dependent enzyme [Terriglobales bacterium]
MLKLPCIFGPQGHCHPRILRTLIGQASKVTLTSRAFRNDQLGPFYRELHELTGFDKALPMNSGAEAVETAVKTARKWGLQGERHSGRQGGDHRVREQFPRAHRDHC